MGGRRYVSTAEVAAALGVSVTTVKRWVDEGVLPADRTPGGHRKLPLNDVLRVIREGDFPRLNLARLGVPVSGEGPQEPRAVAGQLFNALRGRERGAARLLLQEAYQGGMGMDTLADEVVAPAMARLGHEWEKGQIDVLHEHRGTQICLAALNSLKGTLEGDVASGRPVALGGGPEGDPYLLANLLAEMILLELGWDVINLGPNTPLTSFRRAVVEFQPRLVWLSVSYLTDGTTFAQEYRALYEEAVRAGAAVAVGGQALTEDMRAGLPYTTHGDRLTHLAAFARSLHPRPRRRRRGRPRRT